MFFYLCHQCNKEVKPVYVNCCPKCDGIETVHNVMLWEYTPQGRYYGITPDGRVLDEQGTLVAMEYK